MPDRRIVFLMNPSAGTQSKTRLKDIIADYTTSKGFVFDFVPTHAEGKYPQLESEILEGKYTDIVIIGGDGTVRNVVASLRHTDIPFGLIPTGSGNGLALSARIPVDPKKAMD